MLTDRQPLSTFAKIALNTTPRPVPTLKTFIGTPDRDDFQQVTRSNRGTLIKPPRLKEHYADLMIEFVALKVAANLAAILDENLHIPSVAIIQKEDGQFALELEKLQFTKSLTEKEVYALSDENKINLLIKTLIIDLILMDRDGHIGNLAWKEDHSGLYRYDFDLANSDKMATPSIRSAISYIRSTQGTGFALQSLGTEILCDKIADYSGSFSAEDRDCLQAIFGMAIDEIRMSGIEITDEDELTLQSFGRRILGQIEKLRTFDPTERDEDELLIAPSAPGRPVKRRSDFFEDEGSPAKVARFSLEGSPQKPRGKPSRSSSDDEGSDGPGPVRGSLGF